MIGAVRARTGRGRDSAPRPSGSFTNPGTWLAYRRPTTRSGTTVGQAVNRLWPDS